MWFKLQARLTNYIKAASLPHAPNPGPWNVNLTLGSAYQHFYHFHDSFDSIRNISILIITDFLNRIIICFLLYWFSNFSPWDSGFIIYKYICVYMCIHIFHVTKTYIILYNIYVCTYIYMNLPSKSPRQKESRPG